MRRLLILLLPAFATALDAGTVRTLEGDLHTGKVSIGAGGALTITATVGGGTTLVDAHQVLLAVFRDETRTSTPETRGALLTDGSFAAGRVTSDKEGKSYRIEGARNFQVSAERIARLVFRQIPEPRPTGRKTGVLLGNGDFSAGTVTRLEKDRVEITSLLFGPQSFRLPDEAAGIVLAPVNPEPAAYEIATTDGSLFRVASFQMENDQLVIQSDLLGKFRIPAADLDRLRAGDGRFRALPALAPPVVKAIPGVDTSTAFRAVLSAANPAPPVLGRRADNALVLAAGASATYAVPEGLDFIAAELAVPDTAPPGTRITFVVVADGRVVQRSAATPTGSQ